MAVADFFSGISGDRANRGACVLEPLHTRETARRDVCGVGSDLGDARPVLDRHLETAERLADAQKVCFVSVRGALIAARASGSSPSAPSAALRRTRRCAVLVRREAFLAERDDLLRARLLAGLQRDDGFHSSPWLSCGMRSRPPRRRPGARRALSSTSRGYTLKPPRRIMSFLRSTMK